MLSYLKGILTEKNPATMTVEVGGIGFEIIIPRSTYDNLGEIGGSITILTYLHVREDAMVLFGFVNREEKELFELLLGVSGIGPKVAIGILSGVSVEEFKNYIYNRNLTALTSISGIGKKTAERLILELYDKIAKQITLKDLIAPESKENYDIKNQAIQALCALGYNRQQAERAIAAALFSSAKSMPLEEIIRESLKIITK